MKELNFIRQNKANLQLVLSFFTAFFASIYVNLLTNGFQQGNIIPAIYSLGWNNIWGMATLLTFLLQIGIASLEEVPIVDREKSLKILLEAAARSIAYPHDVEGLDIRIFCHIADKNIKALRPQAKWTHHYSDDDITAIPYSGTGADKFIISKAFNKKRIIAENLPLDHISDYPEELKTQIKPQIRCVLAAPIWGFDNPSSTPLGTISIDSIKPLQETGFDTSDAKDIIKLIAECVYFSLRARLN